MSAGSAGPSQERIEAQRRANMRCVRVYSPTEASTYLAPSPPAPAPAPSPSPTTPGKLARFLSILAGV